MADELVIPETVRSKAHLFGAAQWLAGLAELVADLEREWSIRVGRTFPDATEALVTEATLADGIATTWEAQDRPCPERTIDHAIRCAERRVAAHDDERAVLVHGDVHEWNALRTTGGSFKLVDPDGLLADAEYDLGIMMREDPVELMSGDPMDRAHWLAARCGLDATAIWEWGVVERVSTGLLGLQIGMQPVAGQMLAAADAIAVTAQAR